MNVQTLLGRYDFFSRGRYDFFPKIVLKKAVFFRVISMSRQFDLKISFQFDFHS